MKTYQVLTCTAPDGKHCDYNWDLVGEFSNEDEARKCYNELLGGESPALAGELTLVRLLKLEEDEDGVMDIEELEEGGMVSPALQEGAVVVIFWWHRHVGYARDIKEVRYPRNGETWAELPCNDYIFRYNVVVYDSPADLRAAYERGDLKIHSGASLVEGFIWENSPCVKYAPEVEDIDQLAKNVIAISREEATYSEELRAYVSQTCKDNYWHVGEGDCIAFEDEVPGLGFYGVYFTDSPAGYEGYYSEVRP